jgi:mannose-6-phosphate isomerase
MSIGDANHKPEIAVALSKFEVFVGWKPLPEIQHLFMSISTLKSRFIQDETHFNNETLKKIVGQILSLPDEEIAIIYHDLRNVPTKAFGNHTYIPELLPRLSEQYGKSDPGNLVALLTMNYLILHKGDAIYVPADGIHAYLSGDIVECMARSDNVLNTGFCPRGDKDSVDLFTAALTFSPKSADDAILKPKSSEKGANGHTKVLAPPMSEFDMLVTGLKGQESEAIKALQGPSIMVVTSGSGTMKADGKEVEVKEGYVFFIGYNTEIELKAENGLETHTAFCEA